MILLLFKQKSICMYVYIYIYMYTHMHTYIYIYIYPGGRGRGPREPSRSLLRKNCAYKVLLSSTYQRSYCLTNKSAFLRKVFSLLDLRASSLRRGHADLLRIAPILTDDPRGESKGRAGACWHRRPWTKHTFCASLFPCEAAAETPPQPLIWCVQSNCPKGLLLWRGVFSTDADIFPSARARHWKSAVQGTHRWEDYQGTCRGPLPNPAADEGGPSRRGYLPQTFQHIATFHRRRYFVLCAW